MTRWRWPRCWRSGHCLSPALMRRPTWRGGRWRWIQTDPDGNAFAFRGVYHEVVAPERIIGQQIRSLDQQITQATELRGRLTMLRDGLMTGAEPDSATT